ncbi:MAG: FadR family transcriptional regulator [Actinobacteria bacterium]|nr:FadR family transcriptional regulator [Actinomycetota bacterium]
MTPEANPALPSSLRLPPRETPLAEITRKLIDYLLSGAIAPGEKIPGERHLAEALGIGRSSVREAIKSLSLLGLLDVRQGDGTYLSRSGSDLLPKVIEWGLFLNVPSIVDLLEARAEIEVAAAGFAAARADAEAKRNLGARLDEMRDAGSDVDAYVEADIGFHLEIARASGNEVFANLVGSMRSLLRVWVTQVLRQAGSTDTSFALHEPIVTAIVARNADQARAAMRLHMESADDRLREALASETAGLGNRDTSPGRG